MYLQESTASLCHNDEFGWNVVRVCRSTSKVSVTMRILSKIVMCRQIFVHFPNIKFRHVRSVWVALFTADRPRDERINIARLVVAFSDWLAKAPEKSSMSSGLDFSGSEHETMASCCEHCNDDISEDNEYLIVWVSDTSCTKNSLHGVKI